MCIGIPAAAPSPMFPVSKSMDTCLQKKRLEDRCIEQRREPNWGDEPGLDELIDGVNKKGTFEIL